MRLLSLLFSLLIVVVGASFAILNANMITVNYYFGHLTLPLSVLLLLTFILGVLVGMVAMLGKIWRLKRAACHHSVSDKHVTTADPQQSENEF